MTVNTAQVGHRAREPADILSSAVAVPGAALFGKGLVMRGDRVSGSLCLNSFKPGALHMIRAGGALPVGIGIGNYCGEGLPTWDSQVTLVITVPAHTNVESLDLGSQGSTQLLILLEPIPDMPGALGVLRANPEEVGHSTSIQGFAGDVKASPGLAASRAEFPFWTVVVLIPWKSSRDVWA